ncbi:hypothetical protein CRG98_028195 [Punica granatum]|uniref:Uncharacterized protein n=1 Tax=Punica granatum TaxID=22663 RepID=A0A2I0J5B0_PUNGR|nr:hypothetical protein CRG98_028195 [Punica granatum]
MINVKNIHALRKRHPIYTPVGLRIVVLLLGRGYDMIIPPHTRPKEVILAIDCFTKWVKAKVFDPTALIGASECRGWVCDPIANLAMVSGSLGVAHAQARIRTLRDPLSQIWLSEVDLTSLRPVLVSSARKQSIGCRLLVGKWKFGGIGGPVEEVVEGWQDFPNHLVLDISSRLTIMADLALSHLVCRSFNSLSRHVKSINLAS